MKIIKINIFIIVILTIVSCDDFLDINQNPEQAQEVPANLSIPAGIAQIAGALSGQYSIFGGIWSQHWAQNPTSAQYKSEDSYNITSADYNNEWDLLYSDALIDLKLAENKASAAEDWNVNLQAVSASVFTFQILVDLYDKVPYFEALQSTIFNAAFDDGEAIYTDLIARLDAALDHDFSASTNSFNPNDFIFGNTSSAGGQAQSWIEFANTLKLKLYLRQLEARPDVARNGIMKLINSGASFLTEDAAITAFEDADSKRFPLFENDRVQLNTGTNIKMSNTFVSFLTSNNDPRIVDFAEVNDAGEYFGILNGSFNVPTANLSSQSISQAAILPTQPFHFFSIEEVYFMLAEAYARVMDDVSTSKTMYESGVRAAFNRYGYDASSHLAPGGAYEFPASGDLREDILKTIIMQKWASYNYRGYESFFEQNRTGFPKISADQRPPANITYLDVSPEELNEDYTAGEFIISLESVLSGNQLPRRLIYPDSEVNVNSSALEKLPTENPVWWDMN